MYEFVKYDVMLSQLFVLIVILFAFPCDRERERDLVASDCDSAPCAFSYFPIYKVNCSRLSYQHQEAMESRGGTYLNIL